MAFDKDQKPVSGILFEDISLGLKRRLQKIHRDLSTHYSEYVKDVNDLKNEVFKEDTSKATKKSKEQKEAEKALNDKFESELKILDSETVQINHEKVSLSIIEAIQTKHNYDFEVIELIAA